MDCFEVTIVARHRIFSKNLRIAARYIRGEDTPKWRANLWQGNIHAMVSLVNITLYTFDGDFADCLWLCV